MIRFSIQPTVAKVFLALLWIKCATGYAGNENALTITNVMATPAHLTTDTSEVAVRFLLSKPASVELTIYDARNFPISRISSEKTLPAGEHTLRWAPHDKGGNQLPDEAYVYTLLAETVEGEITLYDLTDITGGETVYVEEINYDPEMKKVSYYLPKTARIFLRVGIENGFVIRTLVNGAVRQAGFHEEIWDGKDANGVLTLSGHPNLRFYGSGYQLSQNSLIVTSDKVPRQNPIWLDKQLLENDVPPRLAGQKPKATLINSFDPA